MRGSRAFAYWVSWRSEQHNSQMAWLIDRQLRGQRRVGGCEQGLRKMDEQMQTRERDEHCRGTPSTHLVVQPPRVRILCDLRATWWECRSMCLPRFKCGPQNATRSSTLFLFHSHPQHTPLTMRLSLYALVALICALTAYAFDALDHEVFDLVAALEATEGESSPGSGPG